MKKVLMVAYAFPPVGGAGVQRVVKFIKYLKTHGWSADAVSVLNPSVPLVDESLLRELPPDCTVFRSKTYEPSYAVKASMKNSDAGARKSLKSRLISLVKKVANNILLPDAQVLWWPHTFLLLGKLLKQNNYATVLVSGPPFSTFFLVAFIAKRYGVPAVIDYRDEWSFSRDNWENTVKTSFARFVDAWMEGYVVRNAKVITVASPYYERTLKERFPTAADKIHTITNGYDPEDFAGVDFFSAPERSDGRFTLLYTGTVWRATSFKGLLGGVRLLAANYPDKAARLNLRILGRTVQEEFDTIDQLKALIHVETRDYVPHEEIFQELASADGLLLTLADLPGAGKIIPGKVFEYLATPLPVLAIVPEGVTVDILRDEKNVQMAVPGDATAISTMLLSLLDASQAKSVRDGVEKYSRPHLTGKLVNLFNHMSA
jgi:glycosyltransferase involved in cell wall biosynthesis